MAALVSSEFVSLCRAQLRSLSQQMANASAAIYIADIAKPVSVTAGAGRRGDPDFVPVVSWPESVDTWVENLERWTAKSVTSFNQRALPASERSSSRRLPEALSKVPSETSSGASSETSSGASSKQTRFSDGQQPDELQPGQQLVVPLVYAEVVVGLLVAVRRDRSWQHDEQDYVEEIAHSLAAGCVLERRNQWLQGQISDKRDLQSRQSEIFHNLLHQFRNPLTAVTTFGQLLVKKLEPEDPNQKIATGIVRESKRLREMVTHFDETVGIGDADLAAEVSSPPLLPAAPLRLPQGLPEDLPEDSPEDSPNGLPEGSTQAQPDASDEQSDLPSTGLGHALTLSAQYLPDIVEPILAVADIVANQKGVALRSQITKDTPSVWGEEEALCEVVSNLVDNAVKYSPSGAQVWVQTGVSRLQYQGIVVGDTGPGIPTSDQTRLFERNYRGVQAQSDIPGTGLGLAIAQSLMNQMQGFIEVISPAVGTPWMPERVFDEATDAGSGTVFVVWLLEVER